MTSKSECKTEDACYGDCKSCLEWAKSEEEDEWDFPEGTTCNPDAPEECESCQ